MTPILAADFRLPAETPSAADLADAARERHAAFLVVAVPDEEEPQAFVDGRRIAGLARVAAAARKQDLGLVVRLEGTMPLPDLRAALEVEKGTPVTTLRGRLLVVVRDERTGKRLRRDAPEFPSAYEMPPRGERARGLLRFASPMRQRAAADAEDLVVPWGAIDGAKLVAKYVPELARRGSHLWLSDVDAADAARALSLPLHGVIARFAWGERAST